MSPKGRGYGVTPPRVIEELTKRVKEKSQYAVAKETGLALSVIQGLLKGNREPSTSTLEKLGLYFERPVRWLRGEDIIDFWGQTHGDNPDDAALKDFYWEDRAATAFRSPIILEVVKTLTKVKPEYRSAAFRLVRELLETLNSFTDEDYKNIQSIMEQEMTEHLKTCHVDGSDNNEGQ